jgi:hypothetical protein
MTSGFQCPSVYRQTRYTAKLPTARKVAFNEGALLPRSIAPRFIANLAYRQDSRLSRFPPL